MNKKKIKRILVILFIVFILLITSIIIIKYLNSKLYMKNLLSKGSKNINFIETNDTYKRYVKNNKEKIVYNNGNILYYDYNKEKAISINNENKIIYVSNLKDKKNIHELKYNDFDRKEYEYRGIEIINNIKCHVIELFNKDDKKDSYLLKRIWINKKLGIIEKIKFYSVKKGIEKLVSEEVYNMHTGEVSDEDVSEPDLNYYTDFEIKYN